MRKPYIVICLVMTLLISGCNEKLDIDVNDYRPLEGYDFQQHNFLTRKGEEEKDILGGFYSLNGLSPNEYVGFVQYSIIPGNPSKTLYANLNVEEPIICLDPYKIVLAYDDKILTIEEDVIVEQLVNARRKDGVSTSSYPDVYADRRIHMGFLFDVPSNLEWKCNMIFEGNNIKMLWYDNESNEQYVCDITDILKQHSIVDDVGSLVG